jgi:hypothetical protein
MNNTLIASGPISAAAERRNAEGNIDLAPTIL